MKVVLRNPRRELELNGPMSVPKLLGRLDLHRDAVLVIRGDTLVPGEECPMAAGNRHLRYKDALNAIEAASPGTKHAFYFGFLARGLERFGDEVADARAGLGACTRCAAPTPGELCAFCRLVERVGGHDPVPVELVRRRRAS